MKANEFIKRNGLMFAKERIEYCKGSTLVGIEVELKKLIKSHEIVESLGGLESAKKTYTKRPFDLAWGDIGLAIYDVESCQ